jgi:aspartate-semialdehyde dehydrogenase
MLRVGFVGWRGMVGSVLLQRMREENDFAGIEPLFFSTSNIKGIAPPESANDRLKDANDFKALGDCEVLISCQGGDYTTRTYSPLRKSGWKGFWIDAASTLRMSNESLIVLDPVNREAIRNSLIKGLRTFVGGNCTVSLMLMAVGGLFKARLIEWMTTMTYQAASGAGASKMLELVAQMRHLADVAGANHSDNALELDRVILQAQRSPNLPADEFGVPLAYSLIPWIDGAMPGGQTREEWKGMAETNKIMGLDPPVAIDGTCVRIGTMRCHSQALCIKLTRDVPMEHVERLISDSNPWVRLISNNPESTKHCLTPTAVSGSLSVAVGRLRKLTLGNEFLAAFTVGDQLLWGAAEPLRRMLGILREHLAE